MALMEPVTKNEEDFKRKCLFQTQLMNLIESQSLNEYALEFIPAEDLTIKASLNLSTQNNDSCLEDYLALELMNWFKHSFFTWVDIANCDNCHQPTEYKGFANPTSEESLYLASAVDNYFCATCKTYTRFPRYNHPKKLLETRKGRCGEWAICFTLMCRALEMDARLVVDWTDHLWTEIFSPSQQRWVHYDACENVCDQPLLYEVGWKKKLSFIIAFSKDEVQDVTWRYTHEFADVLKRRSMLQCRESYVLSLINHFTQICQSKLDVEKTGFILRRRVLELTEFLTPPKPNAENLGGRTSGSVAWRLARKEISAENIHNSYVFNLSDNEVDKRFFHIQYSCASNEYVRVSDNNAKHVGWKTCAFEVESVFRKVETDWKITYLARSEGSDKGMIVWKFDFEKSGLVIQKLRLNLISPTFHNGKVKWTFHGIRSTGDRIKKVFLHSALRHTFSEDFKGAIGLEIRAELSAGSGPQAWQHAQLFRQTLDSLEFPFEVEVYFEKL